VTSHDSNISVVPGYICPRCGKWIHEPTCTCVTPYERLRAAVVEACEREIAAGFERCCDVLGVGYADLLELADRLSEAERKLAQEAEWHHRAEMGWADESARANAYEQALRAADDLLRRLSEWDVMNLAPLGGHSDVPFWQAEIARVRAALSGSAGSGPAGG
jgi:hypothetical protein